MGSSLRALSGSRDVAQGIAVAKRCEGVSELMGADVLGGVGPLSRAAPWTFREENIGGEIRGNWGVIL